MAEISSEPSEPIGVVHTPDGPWLKDPLVPARNVALSCLGLLSFTRSREQAVHEGVGRTFPIVQTGARRSRRATVTLTPSTVAEAAGVELLLDSGTTLLLTEPADEPGWPGVHVYFRVTGDDTLAPIGPAAIPQRDVTFGLTEVREP